MGPHYFVQGLFAVTGIIALLASLLDWDWFFKAQNTQFIMRNVGRSWARLFYGILGLALMGMAIYFYVEITGTIY
ncbi:MAG: immunity 17 family protein [Mediterranea sp.]|jgi:small neutral amino acid transporter SnatA (MarC family)|nr:immunity 17 family protein [Mediterranea sp.]